MEARTPFGGRHELGQNFLIHQPTIRLVLELVRSSGGGSILELGAGDGALTRPLAALGRDLLAIDLDLRCVRRLQQRLPSVQVRQADALAVPFDRPVVVGNIPFHLTTPILRRLFSTGTWSQSVLLTQWEVARKRAGVGGGTLLTAQTAPWFDFILQGRVPAAGFRPSPAVDGGVISVQRRPVPLLDPEDRNAYEQFVRRLFTGPGAGLGEILGRSLGSARTARAVLAGCGLPVRALPRDITPEQWPYLWAAVRAVQENSRSGRAGIQPSRK
ncbi:MULTISPECIES: 23S ribosomal RNA methyltransferase Erm [unclassified Arthrobacter]|uniref:23S ribosomal RNA methyltransferase Erm n=1 Tax=unclassified Arthrobacter TaxID=235627 RepID=UPI0024DFA7FC|nr:MULTISPECIES: 23S ribosomal RNA methyltransferase Erm [unclassified Arthrobacter]MCC9145008.1 23S ribosomal RNA methyltransferase Erm [Arthrobacter sp. zg-Y919]MDK1276236.1 23S ribosomal RNA methyltransferase Erm [Arthrobacter sp. zg.Y919]MDM7988875.1 23S ribosomal RNA methyltransferase Erm [Arthrobacter sp. zg-Y877]WIB02153.1 23S ribosomal RNA methyltransferase Erm [Arthrobacter sp. zg-Y919]